MKVLLGAVAVAVIGWIVEPWITMARRGTLDEQTLASWREPVIPHPRRSPESADGPVARRPRDRSSGATGLARWGP